MVLYILLIGFELNERKNDSHTISNKTFDFTNNTTRRLIQDGYEETKEQMNLASCTEFG
jgi:hypothetical protein